MAERGNRPSKVLITRREEDLSLLLPIKPQPFRRLLYTVWLAVWLISEGFLIAGLAGGTSVPAMPREGLAVMLALFTVAGVFIAWRFLWDWWGQELFTVDGDALRVRRGIAGLGRTSVFPLGVLRAVKVGSLHYRAVYPSLGRMFIGHGDSQVLLNIGRGPVAYGRGLGESEAADLVRLINDEVRRRSRLTPPHARCRSGTLNSISKDALSQIRFYFPRDPRSRGCG